MNTDYIERKWRKYWEDNNTFKTFLDTVDLKFPKDNYLKVLEEVSE